MTKAKRTTKRKKCLKCSATKLLTAFTRDNSRPDGRTGWCIECRRARAVDKYPQYRAAKLARDAQAKRAKARPKTKAKPRRRVAAEQPAAA